MCIPLKLLSNRLRGWLGFGFLLVFLYSCFNRSLCEENGRIRAMEHESLERSLLRSCCTMRRSGSGSEASNEVPCSFSTHIGDVVSSTAHNFGQRSG
jgi:hypothetical protein